MGKKSSTDHIVMDARTNAFLCEHCGESYAIALPVAVDMFKAQSDVFIKRHRACKKTWTPPPAPEPPDASSPYQLRLNWWLNQGERGISSNTMLEVITGMVATRDLYRSHPHDPDDFKRCWKLLNLLPELRDGFPRLAEQSPVWARLVEHWDELAAMMPAVQEEWKKGGAMPTATAMYNRMKELGC